jgi:fluoroquinolone resistance protein
MFPQDDYADERFEGLEARDLVLRGKVFENCHFQRCQLPSAKLGTTRFVGGSFESCDLSNLDVRGASLREVGFKGCKLIGVNWALTATMGSLSFESCVLDLASFTGADLRKFKFCAVNGGYGNT